MSEVVDENLVRTCWQGDREAYATLVRRHYRHVFALCLGMVANAHDAEDIAQEAMLKGFANIHRLSRAKRFEPWILKIARNLCLDFLRRQKRMKAKQAERRVGDTGKTDEDHDLERVIGRLPLELRLPLTMYYFEEKKAENIARKLSISHSLVCQRIRAARNELHALLTEGDRHES